MMLRTMAAASLFLLLAPGIALACAVCGAVGPTDNSWAYGAMTVVLSGLPLGMIGGVVFWVHKNATAADDAAESTEPSPGGD